MPEEFLSFDAEKVEQLKEAFNEAVKRRRSTFVLFGHTWYTNYAKYAIEYLEKQLNQRDV